MNVFKFGGASVKDAAAVKNAGEILKLHANDQLVVVISAMGKVTNALEKIVDAYVNQTGEAQSLLDALKNYHLQITNELFSDSKHEVHNKLNNYFVEIEWVLEEPPRDYDFVYDQIVSFGELLSTTIVSAWLNDNGLNNQWLDVRDCLITDNTYREGKIDWATSTGLFQSRINELFTHSNIIITQGFIGSTTENFSTTLGREGSDYTAAIIAHILNAESVTIWKDVPGVLNADPKHFSDAQKLIQLSYQDAIELAYYGASVIHPKTIKPLENKNIPLHVKSFLEPNSKGTVIGKDLETKPLIPSFIFKSNQVLISIAAKDFSFIAEENLSEIFSDFANAGIKLNSMQNSAISFSVCIDDTPKKESLIEKLRVKYKVKYNSGLQLYTIRHYYPSTIEALTVGKEILLEQRSRTTAQLITKDLPK